VPARKAVALTSETKCWLDYRVFRSSRVVPYFLTNDLVYCWFRCRTGGYVCFSSEGTLKKERSSTWRRRRSRRRASGKKRVS